MVLLYCFLIKQERKRMENALIQNNYYASNMYVTQDITRGPMFIIIIARSINVNM